MKKEHKFENKNYFKVLVAKLGMVAVLLGADLATKIYFASQNLDITVWRGVLGFTYTENTGAAFSLFSNATSLLAAASVLFVIAFFVFDWFEHKASFQSKSNWWYNTGFALIVAGAVGNMIDRFALGYVRDFIRFEFVQFPIFNVADMCLTIGLVLYGVYVLFFAIKEQSK